MNPLWQQIVRPFGRVPKVNKALADAPQAAVLHADTRRGALPRSIRRDRLIIERDAFRHGTYLARNTRRVRKAAARIDRRYRALTVQSTRRIIRLRSSRVMAAKAGGPRGAADHPAAPQRAL